MPHRGEWHPCGHCTGPTVAPHPHPRVTLAVASHDPQWARRGHGLPELTAGQLSGGHAFFLVTTTSPSWCFSHSWVTQGFVGSGQDWPGCKEKPASKVRGQGSAACRPPARGPPGSSRSRPGTCLAMTAPQGPPCAGAAGSALPPLHSRPCGHWGPHSSPVQAGVGPGPAPASPELLGRAGWLQPTPRTHSVAPEPPAEPPSQAQQLQLT